MNQPAALMHQVASYPTAAFVLAGFSLSWLLSAVVVVVLVAVHGAESFEWGVGTSLLLCGGFITLTYLLSLGLLGAFLRIRHRPWAHAWLILLVLPFLLTPAYWWLTVDALPWAWHFPLFAVVATALSLPLLRPRPTSEAAVRPRETDDRQSRTRSG